MTYLNFLKLPVEQMLEIIWYKGIYITRRIQNPYIVELYAVDNFFVEIGVLSSHGVINDNFLTFTNAFKGSKGLEPYLIDKISFGLIKSI